MAKLVMSKWHGEFHFSIVHNPPKKRNNDDSLSRFVAEWEIEMSDEQLGAFSIDDLKRLYADKIEDAKRGAAL